MIYHVSASSQCSFVLSNYLLKLNPCIVWTYVYVIVGENVFELAFKPIYFFLPQAAKEQTQDLIVKTNKLQGEK